MVCVLFLAFLFLYHQCFSFLFFFRFFLVCLNVLVGLYCMQYCNYNCRNSCAFCKVLCVLFVWTYVHRTHDEKNTTTDRLVVKSLYLCSIEARRKYLQLTVMSDVKSSVCVRVCCVPWIFGILFCTVVVVIVVGCVTEYIMIPLLGRIVM